MLEDLYIIFRAFTWDLLLNKNLSRQARKSVRNAYYRWWQRIPSKDILSLFPKLNDVQIQLAHFFPEPQGWNVTLSDLNIIVALIALRQPKIIFEFGTYNGNTTLQMALNVSESSKIWTLDKEQHHPDRLELYSEEVKPIIKRIYSDTMNYEASSLCGQVDFVFVDAGHTYRYAKNDSEKALSMLAKGGVIVWHDYMGVGGRTNGVSKYLEEMSSELSLVHIIGTSLVIYDSNTRDQV